MWKGQISSPWQFTEVAHMHFIRGIKRDPVVSAVLEQWHTWTHFIFHLFKLRKREEKYWAVLQFHKMHTRWSDNSLLPKGTVPLFYFTPYTHLKNVSWPYSQIKKKINRRLFLTSEWTKLAHKTAQWSPQPVQKGLGKNEQDLPPPSGSKPWVRISCRWKQRLSPHSATDSHSPTHSHTEVQTSCDRQK